VNFDLNDITLPKLLKSNAATHGSRKTALRKKGLGIWQCYNWEQYLDNVRSLSLGLHSLGFNAGEKLAIVSSNRPESLFSEIAAQAAGGISISLYNDSTPLELSESIRRFDVSFVIVEDQEQVDKILEQLDKLPQLRRVIYIKKRGMRKYCNERLLTMDSVQELGSNVYNQHPDLFDKMLDAGNGDDTAIICLSSGTAGSPKGAMLSFKNLISMGMTYNEADARCAGDEYVSLLPMAWFGEQLMAVVVPLLTANTVNFPEKNETTMSDLREIGPHIMLSPPKTWESIAASVRVRMLDSTPFKKFMFNTFMPVGEYYAKAVLAGKVPSFSLRFARFVADILLFRALRDRLGLSNIRSALSGGASLGADVFKFFHAIGVNLKQFYGLTEIAGIACMHRDGAVRDTTAGVPLKGIELQIDENGEVLSRGSGIFKGYYGDDEATKLAFTTDGWLKSGDAGYLNSDGHITITDLLDDILTLSDNSTFSTQQIENSLRYSPYIAEAVVFGGQETPITALIGISSRIVGKWAGDNKLSYMTFADLTSRSEVIDLIEGEVLKANATLPELARINGFAIIYKELDADEGELTRTGKVRREQIKKIYQDLIKALGSDDKIVPVDTVIEFPDGKSGHIKTTVAIRRT
jgi:long-chain acyl-CoA synthetase